MAPLRITPTREEELALLARVREHAGEDALIAGVDEVGRGALAGPVSVGIALIGAGTSDDFPVGLRDSKQLSAAARTRLAPLCRQWAVDVAVGHAGPDVVDREGIMAALRHAAANALSTLIAAGHRPLAVLLDGNVNWWTDASLFVAAPLLPDLPVLTKVKGDASCAVIAAASVAAKVERDALMVTLDAQHPGYDWARNKGYASPTHIAALRELGASPQHRVSWRLPGLSQSELSHLEPSQAGHIEPGVSQPEPSQLQLSHKEDE